ncbi:hypothetical protein BJ508DRAFT_332147 [Ascobolus immersus RN42]|uniref:Uncharacterized protein n=1 Tax=Ascobolus immersus RN42 TaxID=1160509 RepID=A0A3N4HNL7_ASCIM|nr:hypothetical protein BJ508DRAFT_332147 [Ascobolus immersus RN42]
MLKFGIQDKVRTYNREQDRKLVQQAVDKGVTPPPKRKRGRPKKKESEKLKKQRRRQRLDTDDEDEVEVSTSKSSRHANQSTPKSRGSGKRGRSVIDTEDEREVEKEMHEKPARKRKRSVHPVHEEVEDSEVEEMSNSGGDPLLRLVYSFEGTGMDRVDRVPAWATSSYAAWFQWTRRNVPYWSKKQEDGQTMVFLLGQKWYPLMSERQFDEFLKVSAKREHGPMIIDIIDTRRSFLPSHMDYTAGLTCTSGFEISTTTNSPNIPEPDTCPTSGTAPTAPPGPDVPSEPEHILRYSPPPMNSNHATYRPELSAVRSLSPPAIPSAPTLGSKTDVTLSDDQDYGMEDLDAMVEAMDRQVSAHPSVNSRKSTLEATPKALSILPTPQAQRRVQELLALKAKLEQEKGRQASNEGEKDAEAEAEAIASRRNALLLEAERQSTEKRREIKRLNDIATKARQEWEKQLQAEQARVRDEENTRLYVEKRHQEAEAAEKRRKEVEAERKRLEADLEAERRRQAIEAEAERRQLEAEAERKQQELEAERKRLEAEVERRRQAIEAEAERRRLEAEAERKQQKLEAERKQQELEAERKRQESLKRQQEEEEMKRLEEQEEMKRLEEEEERKRLEENALKKQQEAEAERKRLQMEMLKKRQLEEQTKERADAAARLEEQRRQDKERQLKQERDRLKLEEAKEKERQQRLQDEREQEAWDKQKAEEQLQRQEYERSRQQLGQKQTTSNWFAGRARGTKPHAQQQAENMVGTRRSAHALEALQSSDQAQSDIDQPVVTPSFAARSLMTAEEIRQARMRSPLQVLSSHPPAIQFPISTSRRRPTLISSSPPPDPPPSARPAEAPPAYQSPRAAPPSTQLQSNRAAPQSKITYAPTPAKSAQAAPPATSVRTSLQAAPAAKSAPAVHAPPPARHPMSSGQPEKSVTARSLAAQMKDAGKPLSLTPYPARLLPKSNPIRSNMHLAADQNGYAYPSNISLLQNQAKSNGLPAASLSQKWILPHPSELDKPPSPLVDRLRTRPLPKPSMGVAGEVPPSTATREPSNGTGTGRRRGQTRAERKVSRQSGEQVRLDEEKEKSTALARRRLEEGKGRHNGTSSTGGRPSAFGKRKA